MDVSFSKIGEAGTHAKGTHETDTGAHRHARVDPFMFDSVTFGWTVVGLCGDHVLRRFRATACHSGTQPAARDGLVHVLVEFEADGDANCFGFG